MNFQIFFLKACLYTLIFSAIISIVYIIKNTVDIKKSAAIIKNDPSLRGFSLLEIMALIATILSFVFISASIIIRVIETGHGPFTGMYEFSIAFVWGILIMSLFFSWKYHNIILNFAGILVAICLLMYANTLSTKASFLVPALQNSYLLSAHVAAAVIAYGAFTIGFIASIFSLIQDNNKVPLLPKSKSLENISYHSVIIGFPFMTLVIVLGALWADIAWGKYWSWDPKEIASLVTWLIYAAYLHTRISKGWQGKKSALILILGFVAVIFTFFGNYIFNGLHSYI